MLNKQLIPDIASPRDVEAKIYARTQVRRKTAIDKANVCDVTVTNTAPGGWQFTKPYSIDWDRSYLRRATCGGHGLVVGKGRRHDSSI